MSKGKSFLSAPEKTASGDEKRHLRIVITSPDAEFNQVVVSVTTLDRRINLSYLITKATPYIYCMVISHACCGFFHFLKDKYNLDKSLS